MSDLPISWTRRVAKRCPSCGVESLAGKRCSACAVIHRLHGGPVYVIRITEALKQGVDEGRREALLASTLEGKELRAFLRICKARDTARAISARVYHRKNRVSVRLRPKPKPVAVIV